MEQVFLELIQKCDVITIIAVFAMFWVFNGHLSKKFDKIDVKFEKLEQKFDARFDKLEEKVTDIDRRLCRLEGAFASKDCCMIKDDSQTKKTG